MVSDITITQAQAFKIADVAAQTGGGALGLSQLGSVIVINTGQVEVQLNAHGQFIPSTSEERFPC